MTTIYTGNTTTTGFTVTSDATGNLVIKTGGAGGTTAVTVGADQRVTFAQPPLTAVPAFSVGADSNQTGIVNNTATKIDFNASEFDTHGWFDLSTDRFTPQIAGYYQFNATVWGVTNNSSTTARVIIYIYKNGSAKQTLAAMPFWGNANGAASGSHLLYMNGSTDYVELYASVTAAGNIFFNNARNFQGFLVRAT